MVTVKEHCRISPPAGKTAGKWLSLTFFDVLWLSLSHIQRVVFYEISHSDKDFDNIVIPRLKESLSLALSHFSPLAGNLIIPTNSEQLGIRYTEGDSVPITFAVSDDDFYNLSGNHARKTGDLYSLVPQLPEPVKSPDGFEKKIPVFGLQVTSFPNVGVSIGITNHHGVGDASSLFAFMKTWASISKNGGESLSPITSPCYDRRLIKDPNGLFKIFQRHTEEFVVNNNGFVMPVLAGAEKIRATFIITRSEIEKLKSIVSAGKPKLIHVSTFTVVSAYTWTCIVKSRSSDTETGDESEFLAFAADCWARLNPPLPSNYFGNCLGVCLAELKQSQMTGEEGFIIGAEKIGQAILERMKNEEGVLKGAENWLSDFPRVKSSRIASVAGSPKFNYYNLDFGWGSPKKVEVVSIDTTGAMSLNEARGSEGGIEIGLSLPEIQMDSFTSIFYDGLRSLLRENM